MADSWLMERGVLLTTTDVVRTVHEHTGELYLGWRRSTLGARRIAPSGGTHTRAAGGFLTSGTCSHSSGAATRGGRDARGARRFARRTARRAARGGLRTSHDRTRVELANPCQGASSGRGRECIHRTPARRLTRLPTAISKFQQNPTLVLIRTCLR